MIHLLKGIALQGQLPSAQREGINPIFKGKIEIEGHSRRCFIKILPDTVKEHGVKLTNREAYSEAIGYVLAQTCGFKVPECAGVILLQRNQIPDGVLAAADAETAGSPQSEFIAWFSEDMRYPDLVVQHTTGIASNDLESRLKARIARDLLKRQDLPALVSFDEWTMNSDRNPGNVLSAGPAKMALIDHGRLFDSRSWQPHNLKNIVKHQTTNQMINWAEFGESGWSQKLPIKSQRGLAYNGFAVSYGDSGQEAARKALFDLSLEGEEVDSVLNFLEQRLDPAHYRDAIGLIA